MCLRYDFFLYMIGYCVGINYQRKNDNETYIKKYYYICMDKWSFVTVFFFFYTKH